MKRSTACVTILVVLCLFFARASHAQNMSCDFVFAGPSATVVAQTQGIGEHGSTLHIGFGGYIQCRNPGALGWNSFADPSGDQRYVSLLLPSEWAGWTPETKAILEARLKDCYRQGLIAMNNPGRLMLEVIIAQPRYNDEPAARQLNLSVWVDTATTIACSLSANNSGLR